MSARPSPSSTSLSKRFAGIRQARNKTLGQAVPLVLFQTLLQTQTISLHSVAISDAILVAQSAFAGGEFQPEAFPRCLCLLLDAFEGGDNAVRLCAARLMERFRPYLGSSILAVEVRALLYLVHVSGRPVVG